MNEVIWKAVERKLASLRTRTEIELSFDEGQLVLSGDRLNSQYLSHSSWDIEGELPPRGDKTHYREINDRRGLAVVVKDQEPGFTVPGFYWACCPGLAGWFFDAVLSRLPGALQGWWHGVKYAMEGAALWVEIEDLDPAEPFCPKCGAPHRIVSGLEHREWCPTLTLQVLDSTP